MLRRVVARSRRAASSARRRAGRTARCARTPDRRSAGGAGGSRRRGRRAGTRSARLRGCRRSPSRACAANRRQTPVACSDTGRSRGYRMRVASFALRPASGSASIDSRRRRRVRGRTSVPGPQRRTPLRPRHDLLLLLAEPLDAERDDVAGLEVSAARLHAHAHARRRAGGDDVAGQQRHVARDVGDERGDAEDHRPRVAALPALAVDVEPHVEVLRILDLVGRHEPRPERSERVAALALAPLRRRCASAGSRARRRR